MIWDRMLQNQWEKRVRRRTQERWRELQGEEDEEEDEREDVQREGGEEEGEEEGGAEDEEERHLGINLTRTKVSTGAEIHYTDTPVTALQHFHRVEYSLVRRGYFSLHWPHTRSCNSCELRPTGAVLCFLR